LFAGLGAKSPSSGF